MNCTATLKTLTPTDVVVATEGPSCPSQIGGNRCLRYPMHEGRCSYGTVGHRWWRTVIPDGVTVTRDGDELQRDDVTVLTCFHAHPHPPDEPFHEALDDDGSIGTWCDDTPGATPHDEPMDELVAVSEQAGLYDDPCPDCGAPSDGYGCHVDCPTGTRPAVTQHNHHPNDCEGCFDMFAAGHRSGVRDEAAHGTAPTVTDEQVKEARLAMPRYDEDFTHEAVRKMLEAAARAQSSEAKSYAVEDCPTVTDAEVEAAHRELYRVPTTDEPDGLRRKAALRRTLEAAARARQDNQDD